jgi:serine/threonine protein kinase
MQPSAREAPIEASSPQSPQPSPLQWDSAAETGLIEVEIERVSETLALGAPKPKASVGERLASMGGFGPYRLLRTLGRGGMGAVFEVEHREVGVRYALKTILAEQGAPGFALQLERFKREAELNARLDHPGILRVHSASFEGSIPYLVVDLLSGGSLGERLDRGEQVSLDEALRYALGLARALAHAHERDVLHRDLKPDNVMLDESGEPRLVDFGLALETGRETRLTRSGTAVGTPATMAPEQIKGDRSETAATDVYGLGATLYWLLAGDPALGGDCENLAELVIQIFEREPDPITKVRPEVPAAFSRLLSQSMSKDPEERPSLAEWIRVSSALGQGVEPEQGRSHPSLLARLALLGALPLAVGGAFLYAQGDSDLVEGPQAQHSESSRLSSSPRDWRAALESGAKSEALGLFLAEGAPLEESDLPRFGDLMLTARLEAAELEGLEGRLAGLGDEARGEVWALACLAAGEAERGRLRTGRGSDARRLIDLEIDRARVDRDRVAARLIENEMRPGAEMKGLYEMLLDRLRVWPSARVAQLSPACQVLAWRVLDRLQLTLGRVVLVMRLEQRFGRNFGRARHGSGGARTSTEEGLRVRAAAPDRVGVGRLVFEIALRGDQSPGGRQAGRALLRLGRPWESALMADTGGRVLYASYAVNYGDDPVRALRLGGLACNTGQREIVPVDSYANRFLPNLVARAIEAEWLGPDLSEASRGLAAVEAYLGQLQSVKRAPPKRTWVSLVAWQLWRGDLDRVESSLRQVSISMKSDPAYVSRIELFRCELELARNPVGAARGVLDRLENTERTHVEHYGIVAHARALLGLDPREALAAVARSREEGLGRVGLAWHALDVPKVIEGEAWWPGQGPAPPSRVRGF